MRTQLHTPVCPTCKRLLDASALEADITEVLDNHTERRTQHFTCRRCGCWLKVTLELMVTAVSYEITRVGVFVE
jgi:hypothetical protein